MRAENTSSKSKTSFYIYDDLKMKMASLIPAGKQTEFINNSIKEILERIEKEKEKKELLAAIKSIKKVTRKTTARQTLEKSRKERDKILLGSATDKKSKTATQSKTSNHEKIRN